MVRPGRAETPVDPEVRALARAFVERECMARTPELAGGLGFVVLHRCGADFYFLLVSTWRNENELWESVYAKDNAAAPEFRTFTFAGAHRGHLLCLGAGCGLARAAGLETLPPLGPRRGREARLSRDQFRGPV
jgi:hypothetical protein